MRALLASVALLSACASATVTCPAAGAAATCYQGMVGASPVLQNVIMQAYNSQQGDNAGGVFYDNNGNYQSYQINSESPGPVAMVVNGIAQALKSKYHWVSPTNGVASLAGGVISTSTGTTTGACGSVTVTCAQLYTWVGLADVVMTAAEFAVACPTGTTVSLYGGLPSRVPCVDAVAKGTASTVPLVKSLMATLNPTLCTTSNCNAPPTVPLPAAAPLTCPVGAASTCYFGISGTALDRTASNYLLQLYRATTVSSLV